MKCCSSSASRSVVELLPKACCTSVNEVICHGIPDSRVLREGDICNIDVTGYIGGVHGDTNATFFVGDVDPESRQARPGHRGVHLATASRRSSPAVRSATSAGRSRTTPKQYRYGVVRAFVGHGIGEQFHTDIQVLHYYDSRPPRSCDPGMTFTIEPMITLGTVNYKMWDDDWTAVTADGKRTAQFEHTDPRHRRRHQHSPLLGALIRSGCQADGRAGTHRPRLTC
jgi:methionyl aminopeptidase